MEGEVLYRDKCGKPSLVQSSQRAALRLAGCLEPAHRHTSCCWTPGLMLFCTQSLLSYKMKRLLQKAQEQTTLPLATEPPPHQLGTQQAMVPVPFPTSGAKQQTPLKCHLGPKPGNSSRVSILQFGGRIPFLGKLSLCSKGNLSPQSSQIDSYNEPSQPYFQQHPEASAAEEKRGSWLRRCEPH